MKFYRCNHCGKILVIVNENQVPTFCCGEEMKELIPGTTDAAAEKHVPQYEVKGELVTVKVGSVEHPMQPEHFIEWIAVETNAGYQLKYLNPGEAPAREFVLAKGETVKNVYAYCNLHRLWMA